MTKLCMLFNAIMTKLYVMLGHHDEIVFSISVMLLIMMNLCMPFYAIMTNLCMPFYVIMTKLCMPRYAIMTKFTQLNNACMCMCI